MKRESRLLIIVLLTTLSFLFCFLLFDNFFLRLFIILCMGLIMIIIIYLYEIFLKKLKKNNIQKDILKEL